MRMLGNLVWFVFGGAITGILWGIAGVLWAVTVIGIPISKQCFKISFQIVMAALFVFLLLVLALRFMINTVTHRRGRQILAFAGGAEAARLFFRFFVP